MFRKDFHIKSNTAVKGSDRRKLRSNVAEQFPDVPADVAVPVKDNITVMKIFTHADYTVLVYCVHGEPIFFEWEKQLYPTVYTLWKYPCMLTSLITWPAVLDKMMTGADLMLPGVIIPPSGRLPNMTRGQLCAVCLPDNGAAVAVGWTVMSTQDMIASGMKGKGVHTLHCYKDHLWKHGSKSHPPVLELPIFLQEEPPSPTPPSPQQQTNDSSPPDNQTNSDTNSTHQENCTAATAEGDGGQVVTETVDGLADLHLREDRCVEGGNQDVEEAVDEDEEFDDIPPADKMDKLLYQCLLHCIKSRIKKSDLPILTSNFYRNHMLACCPKNQTLDIKKSNYKKLSKFLQTMAVVEELLRIETTKKGVDSIVEVDRTHPDVRAFVLPDDFSIEAHDASQQDGATANRTADVWRPPEVKEFHQVTSKMAPILQPSGYRIGNWLTADQVRATVTEYVKQNGMADKTDRRLVILDPLLHDALIRKNEDSRTHLKWDQVFSRSFRELTAGHQLILGNPDSSTAENSQSVKKSGRLPRIELKVQRKAGNKVVTLITHMETFGIEPKDFSQRLQRGVSASSSVSALPGQNAGQQVLVQGNQINYIEKILLDHYKIPRKYIQGLELAPKSGGGKKKR